MAGFSPGQKATVIAAVATGAITGVAALLVPVITEGLHSEPPPASCLKVITDYRDFAQKSPENWELVMPGADGQSYILRDPNAINCDIKPGDLQLPAPPTIVNSIKTTN